MLEILVVLLALATVSLGVLVRDLFQENRQIRSDMEARLEAIENLEGPFERKLADAGPTPLKRVLSLNIHLDRKFWAETLQLTPLEMDEIRTRVRLPHDLSEKAGVEDFEKWFYGNIRVRIQEWRGGYIHIEVEYPLCPFEKRKAIELYMGDEHERGLWRFDLPARAGTILSSTLCLQWDRDHIRLYAVGGRFGWASFVDPEPAPHNIFVSAPLQEGPSAEPYFEPTLKVMTWRDVYLQPWERRYQHLDFQRGLAWKLWIEDCDLLTRSQGNGPEGRRCLLAEWRERFAFNDAGKEWYQCVAKAMEDEQKKETAEFEEWIRLRDEQTAPDPDAVEET